MIKSFIDSLVQEFSLFGHSTFFAAEQTSMVENPGNFILIEPTSCLDQVDHQTPMRLSFEIRFMIPDSGQLYLQNYSDAVNAIRGVLLNHVGVTATYLPLILETPSYSGALAQCNVILSPASDCGIKKYPQYAVPEDD